MTQAQLGLQDISDPRFRAVCAQILEKMDEHHVPGVSIGILCDGVEYTAGFGITNIDYSTPVTSQTLFQIGSITKTFTATAVIRLVEQGLLDLDTPIRTYLPELRLPTPEATERATLRHVLTHTGGWLGDHMIGYIFGEDAIARYVASLADVPVLSGLGEVWSYSNSGFTLAGRVVEVVTGKTFETAMRELMLDPLGMKGSFYFMHEVMNRHYASGHTNKVGTNELAIANPWPRPRSSAPSGGIASNVHDMLRYARFVLGDGAAENGGRLLQTETYDRMRTPQVAVGGGLADYVGFSFLLRDFAGVRVVYHGGATNGQKAVLETVPSRRFAVVVLTNSDNGGTLYREMLPVIYETFLGLKEPEAAPVVHPVEKAAEYAGVYRGTESELTVSVGEDCQLVVKYRALAVPKTGEPAPEIPPVRARFIRDDLVMMLDQPFKGLRNDFVRGPDGAIRWLRFGGRIARRV